MHHLSWFRCWWNQPGWTNIIQYVTIQTLGNAEDFGDLTDTTNGQGSGKHRHV